MNIQKIYGLAQQRQKLQKKLNKTLIRSKENGVIIEITASMKLKKITIEKDLLSPEKKEELEEAIKNAFIKGQQKAQEIAMEKTKEKLDLNLNNLQDLI